ncbi:hypothetical protein ACOMHN_004577 [Nucella lapillus]
MVISLIWCAGYRWLISALCLAVTFQDFTFGMTVPNRPYITVSPNPSLHGQELTMSCLPGSQLGGPLGGPPGVVVWRNDTKQLPGAVGETVRTQADAGHPSRFLCQRGGASQPLSLPFAPRVSYLLITLQSASPVDGQLMTLTCLTSDSVEKTGFRWMKWFRNDREIEGAEARTLEAEADVANPGFFECKVFTDVVLVSYPFYPKGRATCPFSCDAREVDFTSFILNNHHHLHHHYHHLHHHLHYHLHHHLHYHHLHHHLHYHHLHHHTTSTTTSTTTSSTTTSTTTTSTTTTSATTSTTTTSTTTTSTTTTTTTSTSTTTILGGLVVYV